METYSDLAYILLTSPVFILGITFLSYIFFNRINLIHIFFGPQFSSQVQR
ncbi:hypothetical protein FAM18123_02352 [Lacticaseibacillus paracasei]|nr:hypothetical protein FAM18123_02352 [Lacticaseibacillus paracasei]